MKERPILFSGPMIRALIAGTKTQTRRVVKPSRSLYLGRELAYSELCIELNSGNYRNAPWEPGDRLWVREAHYIIGESKEVLYRATDDSNQVPPLSWPGPWLPSIHMPRWASRITLGVTGVRVQRLQDISEEDAMAEGAEPILVPPDGGSRPHYEGFRELWEQINGADSWAANPWVWVIEFRRLEQPA